MKLLFYDIQKIKEILLNNFFRNSFDFFQREEAQSNTPMNMYGVIVDGIGESTMTLFQLCIYTVYFNQAIQAAGYFIFANDTKGILHYLAPIVMVSSCFYIWVRSSAQILYAIFPRCLRNPTKSISNRLYHEYSTTRNSSFFGTSHKEPISNFLVDLNLNLKLRSLYQVKLFYTWQYRTRISVTRNEISARDRRSKMRLPVGTELAEL